MVNRQFRPSVARTQNAMKMLNSTKTNATIRDLEEEEGELEEKEGTVVSIKRDLINGAGWTVKDSEGQTYICSCASSMYEVPETVERGGILYPTDTVEVTFTVNPVLRINTIKEIKSLGSETEKIDISKWTHGDESTTVIAKPMSALSISDGFITMNYDNQNQVIADDKEVKTTGKKTNINTNTLQINSDNIKIGDIDIEDYINQITSNKNKHKNYNIESSNNMDIIVDRNDNMAQMNINGRVNTNSEERVIGHIKDQDVIPLRKQTQQLITDGNCINNITIDEDGIISISSLNECELDKIITLTYNWLAPQILRNYIKVYVVQTCDECKNGINVTSEYINYCPSCNRWGNLIDTQNYIKCTCGVKYCKNCGTSLSNSNIKLRQYQANYIDASGTTCAYCKDQLSSGTIKQFVNYCPDCETWGHLYQTDKINNTEDIINILKCSNCDTEFCSTCGISQTSHGLTLTDNPVQYEAYKNALRKLKYIQDSG